MTTRETINARRAEIQAEMAALDEQLEELNSMDPVRELAISLHDLQCGYNHTDQCFWYYEMDHGKDDWSGSTHKRYIKKAEIIVDKLPGHSIDAIIDIMVAIRGV